MKKTVPLVVYTNGIRSVIGEADVDVADDGDLFVTARIDEQRREITSVIMGDSGGFSVQQKDEPIVGTLDNPCCGEWNWVTGCTTHSPKRTKPLGILGLFEGIIIQPEE